MSNDIITTDDRLDAIALTRAHLNRDAEAVRVIVAHADGGTYLALLHLTTTLIEVESSGNPHQYLDDLADSVRQTEA